MLMMTIIIMLAVTLSTSIMMIPNSLWLWWCWRWLWARRQYWRCKSRRRNLTTVRSSSRSLHRSKNKTVKARTNQPGLKIYFVTNGWEVLTVFNSISPSLEKKNDVWWSWSQWLCIGCWLSYSKKSQQRMKRLKNPWSISMCAIKGQSTPVLPNVQTFSEAKQS